MSIFDKCKKEQKIEVDSIKVSLIDAEHVSACHKLEADDLIYFWGQRVEIKEITDENGNNLRVLCLSE